MRKTIMLLATAALFTGAAIGGPAMARDRSERSDRADRGELTAGQIADQAAARAAQMKADLRLTPEQDKNWSDFQAVVVDVWKRQVEHRIAWRNARANQGNQGNQADQASRDLIAQMRMDADDQIARGNDRKKLADAAQPLYASLDDQQKRRFAEALFRRDRDRRSD